MKKLFKFFIILLSFFTLVSCNNNQGNNNNQENNQNNNENDGSYSDTFEGITYTVTEDGYYNSKYEVAIYIHFFEKLPSNYFKKDKSQYVTDNWTEENKYSIGGNRFNNREELLPLKNTYTECDINSTRFNRGAERIVFSNNFDVYYTADHYRSFKKIYPKC